MMFHLKSLLLVMQVFLSILYCRSFASGIFEVLASFMICFATMSGERLWSSVNLSRVPQCLGLKVLGNISLARCLQPFLLGSVARRIGFELGRKFPLKEASLLNLFLQILVAILNRFRETAFQFISGSLDLSWEGGSCLLYTSPSPRDRQKSRMPSSA